MSDAGIVAAAGAVVLRRRGLTTCVLLVHRPKYDDWSFPKGKVDPGESIRAAAVREVLEETGIRIRLGPPLDAQTYQFFGTGRARTVQPRTKVVSWWVGRVRGDHDVSGWVANDEIDQVRWVEVEAARSLLTYRRDRATLAEALAFDRKTVPLVVVRHAQARSRKHWRGDDRERTLTKAGERQAARLPDALRTYGVRRLVSSSSRRCWTTLAPYGIEVSENIEVTDGLSQEDATEASVKEEVEWLLALREPLAVCSHRPVLPLIFSALGVAPQTLDPGGMVVVHHRHGRIAAIERIKAPSVG